jgi:hypothetical protein
VGHRVPSVSGHIVERVELPSSHRAVVPGEGYSFPNGRGRPHMGPLMSGLDGSCRR